MAKLSRRKYAVATKALNQIIGREATPVDKRLRAIELLFNLHERHDKMQARAEARARKEAGLPDEPEEETVEEAPELSEEELSPEEREYRSINALLGRTPDGHPRA
jgi:hypothetical protein